MYTYIGKGAYYVSIHTEIDLKTLTNQCILPTDRGI